MCGYSWESLIVYKDHLKRPKWKDKATKHRVNLHEVCLRNLKDNRENHINPISSKFKMFLLGRIQRQPRNGRKYLESSYLICSFDIEYMRTLTPDLKRQINQLKINTGSDNHFFKEHTASMFNERQKEHH